MNDIWGVEEKLCSEGCNQFHIHFLSDDPEVECTPGTAFVGKRYPVLSCTVMEEGYEIESYAYEFGKTGISINVGDQSAEYDEVIKTVRDSYIHSFKR